MPRPPLSVPPVLSRRLLLLGLLAASAPLAFAAAPAERLRTEPSTFLQSQADDLVEWLPWGDAAFARAKAENKPVFVNVGSFTSELSRAMGRQTFSNADMAALLNGTCVCVLVDRDEHPEVAALFLAYIRIVKQSDGAPLNLWLTPELQPFEGAGYLPPSEEWGKASFAKVAHQALDAWKADPAACRKRAGEAVALVGQPPAPLAHARVEPEKIRTLLPAAAEAWRATYDATNAGFGDAPRGLEPELLRFLLKEAPADRDNALATLRALATSAMRDPLDGGFFHTASDAAWHLPAPQKLLADQARIALACLDAAAANPDPLFPAAGRGALDYALARLARADGTFAAAEDATSDEFAGYYLFTADEIDAALGADAAAFKRAHHAEAAGNITADEDATGKFKGKNLLRASADNDSAVAAKLRAVRDRRPAPPRDELATAGAHGLLIAALARAGEQWHEARYTDAAARTLAAVKKQLMSADGRALYRRRGSAVPATPADYAALALGCRELGRTASHHDADALATQLLARAGELYLDPASGHFFATPAKLPPGIFARAPALTESPSPEALVLLAGASGAPADAITAGLVAQLDEVAAPAPGDALLALSR